MKVGTLLMLSVMVFELMLLSTVSVTTGAC